MKMRILKARPFRLKEITGNNQTSLNKNLQNSSLSASGTAKNHINHRIRNPASVSHNRMMNISLDHSAMNRQGSVGTHDNISQSAIESRRAEYFNIPEHVRKQNAGKGGFFQDDHWSALIQYKDQEFNEKKIYDRVKGYDRQKIYKDMLDRQCELKNRDRHQNLMEEVNIFLY
jgi:hypothetical protein